MARIVESGLLLRSRDRLTTVRIGLDKHRDKQHLPSWPNDERPVPSRPVYSRSPATTIASLMSGSRILTCQADSETQKKLIHLVSSLLVWLWLIQEPSIFPDPFPEGSLKADNLIQISTLTQRHSKTCKHETDFLTGCGETGFAKFDTSRDQTAGLPTTTRTVYKQTSPFVKEPTGARPERTGHWLTNMVSAESPLCLFDRESILNRRE